MLKKQSLSIKHPTNRQCFGGSMQGFAVTNVPVQSFSTPCLLLLHSFRICSIQTILLRPESQDSTFFGSTGRLVHDFQNFYSSDTVHPVRSSKMNGWASPYPRYSSSEKPARISTLTLPIRIDAFLLAFGMCLSVSYHITMLFKCSDAFQLCLPHLYTMFSDGWDKNSYQRSTSAASITPPSTCTTHQKLSIRAEHRSQSLIIQYNTCWKAWAASSPLSQNATSKLPSFRSLGKRYERFFRKQ